MKTKKHSHGKLYLTLLILIFAIPSLIVVLILYTNDAYLLIKFRHGIHQPGNLATFIASCTGYLTSVTCAGNIILLCFRSYILNATMRNLKSKEQLIFDDGVTTITYNEKAQTINISARKTAPHVSVKDLARSAGFEAYERVKKGEEEQKKKKTTT